MYSDVVRNEKFKQAVIILKSKWENRHKYLPFSVDETVQAKPKVLARYQTVFLPDNISRLSREDFQSFLLFKNNYHWKGINRHQTLMTVNMDNLRRGLSILLDEGIPINHRLDKLFPGQYSMIPGMGKAVWSAILQVVYPDKYGIWNGTSEKGLELLDILPVFAKGSTKGKYYLKFNKILLELSRSLYLDLWTLDTLWWFLPGISSDISLLI